METRALSRYITEMAQYCVSRLFRWPVLALWCLLAAAVLFAYPELSARGLLISVLFLGAAIVLLRLWDDLADLEHDRARYPDRVLVKVDALKPFVITLALGLAGLVYVLLGHPLRLIAFLTMLLIIALVYHSFVAKSLSRATKAFIILFKYPALLLLAAANPSSRSLLVAVILYAAVGVYEWLEDAELRNAPVSQTILGSVLGCVLISTLSLIVSVG